MSAVRMGSGARGSDMGVRENKVERKLDQMVRAVGGITRKWVSPGRDGVPDRIVIHQGKIWFVEIKTMDGKLSVAQMREHQRLTDKGAEVRTLYGEEEVGRFVATELMS